MPGSVSAVEQTAELAGAARSEPDAAGPARSSRTVRDVGRPGRSERAVLQRKVDAEVRALLARVLEQEQLATEAGSGQDEFFGWPSWSMDTGLTPAQEKFVEHWSPLRVLDDARLLRQLVGLLQRWSSTRGDDASLDEALSLLTDRDPR